MPVQAARPDDLLWWWTLLGAVSVVNVLAWSLAARAHVRHGVELDRATRRAGRVQLLLSAGYVFGCAFRSAFPVIDVPRLCLVDSALSSVLVGRSVATVAELCFAAQCALLLGALAETAGSRFGRAAGRAVVPLIAVAELCSWSAVLTTSNLGHVAEESIWALTAGLLVAGVIAGWPHCPARLRPMAALACAVGTGYVAFMLLVDVPLYWSRWQAQQAGGHEPLGLADGFVRLAGRCTVSWRWEHWRDEIPWMTMYFSIAVWFSVALTRVPARLARSAGR